MELAGYYKVTTPVYLMVQPTDADIYHIYFLICLYTHVQTTIVCMLYDCSFFFSACLFKAQRRAAHIWHLDLTDTHTY